ncbi:MAG: ChaN family lipoprotein [Magnetococcales bacterium]|nr:ChaN family lipoprotein [Magnetococcales bacterium]MBF0156286.1 ChaN family lipoprotein [Magnetococcales bacterium]
MSLRWSLKGLFGGFVLPLVGLLGGCGVLPSPEGAPSARDERILRAPGGEILTREALMEAMAGVRVLYLGEQHDNPRHHAIQEEIIAELIRRGRPLALGFEFFSREQTGWLMNHTVGKPSPFMPMSETHAEALLRSRLGWSQREEWAFYYPLIKLAATHHLPVFGADLDQGIRTRLARTGIKEMFRVEKEGLPLTPFAHPAYATLMRAQLTEVHCGHAPADMVARLYETWLARNDTMAASIVSMLADLPPEGMVIVILGAGHIAHGMGVPERVAWRQPGLSQLALGLREFPADGGGDSLVPQPVTIDGVTFPPEYEYLWYTAPAPAPDGGKEDRCRQFKTKPSN